MVPSGARRRSILSWDWSTSAQATRAAIRWASKGQHPTKHPGPHPSHSGDLRPGDQLFAASVVALDLETGTYRWHFQLIRHDIWDMDVPTPMVLYDTTVDGRPRKGIAVMRTDGYLFLLDRVDGSPLLPIEERSVPQDPYQVTAHHAALSGRGRAGGPELH